MTGAGIRRRRANTSSVRIPLERQQELYRTWSDAAYDQLQKLLDERREQLIQLGFERAFDTVGLEQYGDSTFWLTPERVIDETLAELADAIFYLHINEARAAGDLPPADAE